VDWVFGVVAFGTPLFFRREAAMQGVHAFDPKVKTSIDLESFVAEDHFLRRIDRVLDLSFVRELTAACYADGKGRPSIDPEVFFRMQLVAYFNGITKDRRLCEEVHDNLAYRWFCRLSLEDDVPDHSSLTRIRDRLGEEVFEAVFRRIVAQCQQKGLVKTLSVMTDATLIAADASLNSLHKPRKAAEEEAQHDARIDRWSSATQALEPNPPQPHRPDATWPRSRNPRNSSIRCIRRSTPTVG
jgi:transposase